MTRYSILVTGVALVVACDGGWERGEAAREHRTKADLITTPLLQDLTVDPTEGAGPMDISAEIDLWDPAPVGGLTFDVSTDAPAGLLAYPSTVSVEEGDTSAFFTASVTNGVAADTQILLGVQLEGDPSVAMIQSVSIRATPEVVGISFDKEKIRTGESATGTINLATAAPPGGVRVSLTSDRAGVTVPAIVLIDEGMSTATFGLKGDEAGDATITAASIGTPVTTSFSVRPGLGSILIQPGYEGCRDHTLGPADDESSGAVDLPAPLTFFDTTYDFLFINNNGSVTFEAPYQRYLSIPLSEVPVPIIAPFFADVDTRAGAGQVTYGQVVHNGRNALCVDWIDVGYYPTRTDKLNSFQLLLVDRSDLGFGAYDIIMNYGSVQWEAGGASMGFTAVAGYSAADGVADHVLQFDGSRRSGAFLDSNVDTGLQHVMRFSGTYGRQNFSQTTVGGPAGGKISGLVTENGSTPLARAPVRICNASTKKCPYLTRSSPNGLFVADGLAPGSYVVTATAPAGKNLVPGRASTNLPVGMTQASSQSVTLSLTAPPAPSDSIGPQLGGDGPRVYWEQALTLTYTISSPSACDKLQDTTFVWWHIQDDDKAAAELSGQMFGNPDFPSYKGNLDTHNNPIVLHPRHGYARLWFTYTCAFDGNTYTSDALGFWIDPSGVVRTLSGLPVPRARVTMLRSDTSAGPFEQVVDGSDVMSPENRRNSSFTNRQGFFGWDVIPGYYLVRAQHAGCLSASGAPYVQSEVLTIPPAVLDLDLRLNCPDLEDHAPPVSTATTTPSAGAGGWYRDTVSVRITATDDKSGVKEIVYALSGAQAGGAAVHGATAQFSVSAEGATTVTWFARDKAGNQEARHTLDLRIDRTPPSVSCGVTPAVLWPPNHRLVPVYATIDIGDAASGPGAVTLVSAASSEPDDGTGDGDTTGDIQGWAIGGGDVDGELRAERSGSGMGRTYTLSYQGADQAGNTANCSVTVSVPHNQPR